VAADETLEIAEHGHVPVRSIGHVVAGSMKMTERKREPPAAHHLFMEIAALRAPH
jgi:hypothetical protein